MFDDRLEAEVELLKGLDRRQPGSAHGGVPKVVCAKHELRPKQLLERLCHSQNTTTDEL